MSKLVSRKAFDVAYDRYNSRIDLDEGPDYCDEDYIWSALEEAAPIIISSYLRRKAIEYRKKADASRVATNYDEQQEILMMYSFALMLESEASGVLKGSSHNSA